jgi:hypothetical protein
MADEVEYWPDETDAPIYASDIDKFLYCERNWWYKLQGEESTQLPRMEQGIKQHEVVAQQVQDVQHAEVRGRLWVRLALGLILIVLVLKIAVVLL